MRIFPDCWSSPLRVLPLALLLAASTLLVPATPAFAHHECNNVPNCVSVSSGTIELSRSGSTTRGLECPSSAPYASGQSWDKSSSAVSVTFWPWQVNGTHFAVTNWSPIHRNTVILYIGCSPTAPGGGGDP